MKAEEIRIGNWIDYNGTPVLVDSGTIRNMHLMGEYHQYLPIELSPEILEKAATYAKNYSYYFDVPELKRIVVITWYDNEQKLVFLNDNYIGILHLQYVHELQNLIHALTGSELHINL